MFEYDSIKDFLKSFFSSRLFVLSVIFLLMGGVLLQRLFTLQIINGASYQQNYTVITEKKKTLPGTRGDIYDRNGMLLAYNELAYKVTIQDKFEDTEDKDAKINEILSEVLTVLEKNGDSYVNDFGIQMNRKGKLRFTAEGGSLMRFRADVYGEADIEDLKWNKNLGYNTKDATETQIVEYLQKLYGLDESDYSKKQKYKIMVLRFALAGNSYQKYISTPIATDICEKTKAYIIENKDRLNGVEIEEDYIRKYKDSKYFASIIGYTGKISTSEYESLSAKNKSYSLTDVVGKSGIEQVMDAKLQGKKGSETVFVDNRGKQLDTAEYKAPSAGDNVYLSIDGKLQKAVYDLLEQELAGILYNNVQNIRESSAEKASDIQIPIYDVYTSLINNGIIDTSHFTDKSASDAEKNVDAVYKNHLSQVLAYLKGQCMSSVPETYENAAKEYQIYYSYIVSMLQSNKALLRDKIEENDKTYLAWTKDESISLKEFLNYCINAGWIDYNIFHSEEEYSDSSEIYQDLVSYIIRTLEDDEGFQKKIYENLVQQDLVTGTQLCLILFDQGVIKKDPQKREQLAAGSISAFTFLKECIQNMVLTPAQLALDPCTASCVITDVNTGELLALVSYPGYDNNRLANSVDAEYFAKLQSDERATPMYNHATQERTAPGSTFKMVTATAGLMEGKITPTTKINDVGPFELVDNEPHCWIYPSRHGMLNVSQAIRFSCNYFFYQVGYDLSLVGSAYSDPSGIKKITEYARQYGLGDTTGIEIPESSPQIATQFPVMAAIGQSNHNYTTVQLARYVTAVANEGTVYNYTLLKQLTDKDGKVIKKYKPEVKNTMDQVSADFWKAIKTGNRLVVADLAEFKDLKKIEAAGKTGTAEQVKTRGNHALFVGYAPFSSPKISIATRIPFGYTSHNAADASARILKYYFHLEDSDTLINGRANAVSNASNGFTD